MTRVTSLLHAKTIGIGSTRAKLHRSGLCRSAALLTRLVTVLVLAFGVGPYGAHAGPLEVKWEKAVWRENGRLVSGFVCRGVPAGATVKLKVKALCGARDFWINGRKFRATKTQEVFYYTVPEAGTVRIKCLFPDHAAKAGLHVSWIWSLAFNKHRHAFAKFDCWGLNLEVVVTK